MIQGINKQHIAGLYLLLIVVGQLARKVNEGSIFARLLHATRRTRRGRVVFCGVRLFICLARAFGV